MKRPKVIDATPPRNDRSYGLEGAPEGVTLLHYPDGTWRLRHTCKTVDERIGAVLRCAPRLDPPHEVTEDADRRVSVGPASVLCPDCGLHGWIRKGRWVSA